MVLVAGLTLLLAACSSSPTGSASSSQTSQRPLPAGPVPSKIAKMVCRRRPSGHRETLGVKASVSSRRGSTMPTRADTDTRTANSCSPSRSFELAPDLGLLHDPRPGAGPDGLHRQSRPGGVPDRQRIGHRAQGLEDPDRRHLRACPAQFGKPPTSRADVAVTVADVILACWAGD